eukprot:319422-Chlamydomonas_euryale.AAC.1
MDMGMGAGMGMSLSCTYSGHGHETERRHQGHKDKGPAPVCGTVNQTTRSNATCACLGGWRCAHGGPHLPGV